MSIDQTERERFQEWLFRAFGEQGVAIDDTVPFAVNDSRLERDPDQPPTVDERGYFCECCCHLYHGVYVNDEEAEEEDRDGPAIRVTVEMRDKMGIVVRSEERWAYICRDCTRTDYRLSGIILPRP